ncbi:MAG: HAD family hydrolase [Ruegeria sp.]|uniref:HAD family hydrolase n=1 Tax=Ruegeria sp. TaxID=1879320 RepID=UPI00349ED9E8
MHDLVIFDCDGVLVDSEMIAQQVIVDRLAPCGLVLSTRQSADLFVGGTIQSASEEATRLGADLPADWVPETYSAIFEALRDNTPLIANVVDLLDQLDRRGLPYCVASNGPLAKMEITLGQNGLWRRFEGRRWSAHDVGYAKPHPGLFLHAAHAMNAEPEACIVIEDSASGVKAAAAAGMRCLGFAAHGDGADLRALGAEVFHDMAEVPALLALHGS